MGRRRSHHNDPARRRWIGVAQNVLLVVAALVTAYLVYLAMMKTR